MKIKNSSVMMEFLTCPICGQRVPFHVYDEDGKVVRPTREGAICCVCQFGISDDFDFMISDINGLLRKYRHSHDVKEKQRVIEKIYDAESYVRDVRAYILMIERESYKMI